MGLPVRLATSGVDWGGSADAGKIVLTDSSGNVIAPLDAAAITLDRGGDIIAGRDYKISRTVRATADGALQTADETLLLSDMVEGAAYDSNKWIQSLTTQTMTQATGVITFNASAITTTTTGSMLLSHRFLPYLFRSPLAFRCRLRYSAQAANTIIEVGFGSPATVTTASVGNGAFWRKISAGDWQPVISVNGTEITGALVTDATYRASVAVGEYAMHYVFLEDTKCSFQIVNQLGVLVNKQVIDWGTGAGIPTFAVTHLQAMERLWFSGAAASALQLFISGTSIYQVDAASNKAFSEVQAGQSYSSPTSPTAYTQTANWTNSAAPTTRTFSNTAAAETTLGGLLVANSIAGGATDYIMFGFQVPSPYTFYFTGIRISPPLNQVVAVATTATIFIYGIAFNSSAVSLATAGTYPPMRVALGGAHTAAVALGANALFSGNDIIWQPKSPVAVQPSRFLHVIARELVGTATATETYLWNVSIEGYFE